MELEDAPVVGAVGPRPDGLDVAFWEGLAAGRLLLQRCPACATWIWGPQPACPSCLRREPDWQEVAPRGRIFTWTRTWQPFAPSFADRLPYVTVVVELPHAGGRRLVGLLLGDDRVDPRIGDEVTGAIQAPCQRTGGVAVLRWRRAVDTARDDG